MSQSSPQPYICFRFEDSLRKYEPPLRKRVKNTPEHYSNSLHKRSLLSSKQKIKPIWGSRNIFQLHSKEKMSACSKLLYQQTEIQKKQVSDFACDPVIQVPQENTNFWDNIQLKTKKSEESKVEENDTLLREKIRKCVDEQIDNMRKKVQEQEKRVGSGEVSQFEEIELTIKKVEQLHKELVESLESSVNEIVQSVSQDLDKIQEVEEDLTHPKESKQIESPSSNIQPQPISKYHSQNPFLRQNILFNGGRIKFFGEQKECYLSARIFTRALQTSTLNKIKQHHPYLQNTVQCLSKLLCEDMIKQE